VTPLGWFARTIMATGGLFMVAPGATTDIIALAIMAPVLLQQWTSTR
jgi:UPF0716 family protein affecting phage T7 exclusion